MSESIPSAARHEGPTNVVDLAPGHYVVDPAASRVSFETKHLFGLGGVKGAFGHLDGVIDIAVPATSSSGHLTVDAAGFDSANARRDGLVKSNKFLDVEQHPVITIAFDRIEVDADGGAHAAAAVTARGGTAPVDAALTDLAVEGETVRATITARVDRYAHRVLGAKGMAGRYLDITIALAARRTV